MKLLSIIALTLAFLLPNGDASAQSYRHRPITSPTHNKMVHMHQNVTETGAITAYTVIGPLGVSTSGFGIDKAAAKFDYLPVSGTGIIGVSNPSTKSAALLAGKNWMTNTADAFAKRVGSWMKSQGLTSAIFTYSQDVYIKSDTDGPKKQSLVFNMSIDNKGRPLYGDPKLVDPDPRVAEIIYIPLQPASGLPDTWQYPEAGFIKYRVLDKKLNPLTGWTLIDTAGAFDDEDANTAGGDDSAADRDAKLKCLVDLRNPGCTGPIDAREIMDKTGAAFALLDYVRRVEPDYEEVPTSDADGYGDVELVAKMAISVDARVYDCEKYYNEGYFGFVLALQGEKYLVTPHEPTYAYQLLQNFGAKALSPTEPYYMETTLQNLAHHPELKGHHPDNIVLSPFESQGLGWLRSNHTMMERVIYLAPVTAEGGDGIVYNVVATDYDKAWHPTLDARVVLLSDKRNERIYQLSTSFKMIDTGEHPVNIMNAEFTLNNIASLEEAAIIYQFAHDFLGVYVNGNLVSVGPWGGNMLEYIKNEEYQPGPCPGDSVQTRSKVFLPGLLGGGCYDLPNMTWATPLPSHPNLAFDLPSYIDLRGYLINGRNTIQLKNIYRGLMSSRIHLRIRTCGAKLGLYVEDPPVPPEDASEQGVEDDLRDQIGL